MSFHGHTCKLPVMERPMGPCPACEYDRKMAEASKPLELPADFAPNAPRAPESSADATAGEGPTDAEFLTLVALELEGGCRAYVNTSHGPHNNAFDASDRLRAIASRLAVARSTPPAACAECAGLRKIADKALALTEEVAAAHRDPDSADYNQCERDQCYFCEQVAELRAARSGTTEG